MQGIYTPLSFINSIYYIQKEMIILCFLFGILFAYNGFCVAAHYLLFIEKGTRRKTEFNFKYICKKIMEHLLTLSLTLMPLHLRKYNFHD